MHCRPAQNGTFPDNIFAGTNQAQLHELLLKATQENGETNAVPGFKVDLTNVVSTSANADLAIFTTDNLLSIVEAKVKTSANAYMDLVKKGANSFSLGGLPSGVYTLDVITQKQSEKAAYEGILVVGQATTQQIQSEIVRIETDIDIVFDKPKLVNDPCNYYGRNICDANGECDSERFDCWSDCSDGSFEPTGQCPGDDRPFRTIVDEDEDDNDLPPCDGSFQDCETDSGFVCEAGSTDDNCELDEEESSDEDPIAFAEDEDQGATDTEEDENSDEDTSSDGNSETDSDEGGGNDNESDDSGDSSGNDDDGPVG